VAKQKKSLIANQRSTIDEYRRWYASSTIGSDLQKKQENARLAATQTSAFKTAEFLRLIRAINRKCYPQIT
jgi:hypothetical protein